VDYRYWICGSGTDCDFKMEPASSFCTKMRQMTHNSNKMAMLILQVNASSNYINTHCTQHLMVCVCVKLFYQIYDGKREGRRVDMAAESPCSRHLSLRLFLNENKRAETLRNTHVNPPCVYWCSCKFLYGGQGFLCTFRELRQLFLPSP